MNARRIGCVVGVLAAFGGAATAAACGGVLLGRHAIATVLVTRQLAAAGVTCDARFAVELPLSLDAMTIAPTRCAIASGPIDAVEFVDPAHVTLGPNHAPTEIAAGTARLTLRGAGGQLPSASWGLAAQTLAIPDRLATMARGLAAVAASELPALQADVVELSHPGGMSARFEGVTRGPGRLEATRVSMASLQGPGGFGADLSLRGLVVSAAGAHAEIDGALEIHATIPGLGTSEERMPLGLVTDTLDQPSPSWSLRVQ